MLVPTVHMEGGTYRDGLPLFNADLARRWNVPGLLSLHWSIDGLTRVFLDPAAAPLMAAALLGLALLAAARRTARQDDVLILVGAALVLQWVLNTFVMSLAPNARYYTNVVALMPVTAGYFMTRLPLALRVAATVAFLATAAAVPVLQPYYAAVSAQIGQVRAWAATGPHHLGGSMPQRTLLLRTAEPALWERLPTGDPPVGGTMITDVLPEPDRPENRCADGTPRWIEIERFAPQTRAGRFIASLGLGGFVSPAMVRHIEGSGYRAHLLLHAC